jgi:hypothetical protein
VKTGNLIERGHSRAAIAARGILAAQILEVTDAPHFHAEFECWRPRNLPAARQLAIEIDAERFTLLSDAHASATRFIRLRQELDELPREMVWWDWFLNLIFTAGKNDLLDKYFAGSAYTATFYMGLVDGGSAPTYAAGDTMASHAGWTESTAYSNANRITLSFNAASAGSKALSAAATFNINATATIAGAFFTTNNTKGGTTGVGYSGSNFTGGNRSVVNGDTLNVSATQSV